MRRLLLAIFGLAVLFVGWWMHDENRTHVAADRSVIARDREPSREPVEAPPTEEPPATANAIAEFPGSIALVGAEGESIVVRAIDDSRKPVRSVRVVLVDDKTKRRLAELMP